MSTYEVDPILKILTEADSWEPPAEPETTPEQIPSLVNDQQYAGIVVRQDQRASDLRRQQAQDRSRFEGDYSTEKARLESERLRREAEARDAMRRAIEQARSDYDLEIQRWAAARSEMHEKHREQRTEVESSTLLIVAKAKESRGRYNRDFQTYESQMRRGIQKSRWDAMAEESAERARKKKKAERIAERRKKEVEESEKIEQELKKQQAELEEKARLSQLQDAIPAAENEKVKEEEAKRQEAMEQQNAKAKYVRERIGYLIGVPDLSNAQLTQLFTDPRNVPIRTWLRWAKFKSELTWMLANGFHVEDDKAWSHADIEAAELQFEQSPFLPQVILGLAQ